MSKYKKEREVAIKAIREAAVICRAVASEITQGVLGKKDKSPVTIADFGSQALICKIIEQEFPDDPIIGEEDSSSLSKKENHDLIARLTQHVQKIHPKANQTQICNWIDRGGAKNYSDRFWTLDPIDGTKGFLRKQQYAISLALIVDGEIVLGALGCPNLAVDSSNSQKTGAAFIAVKGEGAYQVALENKGDDSYVETKVSVSTQKDKTQIRFCESVEKAHSSHSDAARIAHSLKIMASPVRLDSQTKYAVVSRGDAEAYLRLPRDEKYREKIWDHAGGVIIAEEAGGRVSDIFGEKLNFKQGRTLKKNLGVIVTNGIHHDAIINVIKDLKKDMGK